MTEEVFGQTADGEAVHRHVISGGGLTAAVLTWGAVIQDLRLADHGVPLVLGFDTLDGYLRRPSYFGAIVGRCANPEHSKGAPHARCRRSRTLG